MTDSRQPPSPPMQTMTRSGERGTLPAGFRLREFQIERVLGEGGFGVVYLAIDTRLERQVAIKEYMPSQLATRDLDWSVHPRSSANLHEAFEAGLRSFINEAKLLASFEHPSLVRVYQFWEEKGTAYTVMPYHPAPTFKQWRKQHGAAPDEGWLVPFLDSLIDAVDALHRQKCLHRDVAPDNVLVLDDRKPLLLDFGAARRVIGDMTQSLTVMLKPGFAPIEQYAETTSLRQGPWTDVYALSAFGYFAITGRAPPQSVGRIVSDEVEPLARVAAGRYAPHVLAALDAGLAVRPESRPQSMAALRALLYGEAQVDDDRTVVPTRPATRGGAAPLPPTSAAPATLHSTFKPTVRLDDGRGHEGGERTRRLPAIDDEATVAAGTAPTLARSTIPTVKLSPTQRERVLYPDDDETLVDTRPGFGRPRKPQRPVWLWAAAASGLAFVILAGVWWATRGQGGGSAPATLAGQLPPWQAPADGARAPSAFDQAASQPSPSAPSAAAPAVNAPPSAARSVAAPVQAAPAAAVAAPAGPPAGVSGAAAAAADQAPNAIRAPAGATAASTPTSRIPTSTPGGAPAAAPPTSPTRSASVPAAAVPPVAAAPAVAAPAAAAVAPTLRAPDGPPPLQITDTGITALQIEGTVMPGEKEPLFSGFTCCNLHFSGDWFTDLNYASDLRVPPGTPIKVTGYGRWRVLVEVDGKPMRLGLDYGRRHETLAQFVRKLTVDRDPRQRIASFPPIVQDAIRGAKLLPGMTREQVVMAVGFPSRYETTGGVNASEWKMWHSSRGSYSVVFDDNGRVKDIVVDDWLRENVVYSKK